ncbi:MAG TPA: hypothetical protein VMW38_26165, partial [Terriglobia bacterium]|nr:hypothetical protein [Terriglobia bacterium]
MIPPTFDVERLAYHFEILLNNRTWQRVQFKVRQVIGEDLQFYCPERTTWRLDICEAAGGRFFLIEPRWGRQTVAQGAVSGRSSGPPSPRRPPWV